MADPIITAQGPQPAQGDESASGHIKVAAAVGGIGAAGFIPTKGGRIWDHYLRAIRNTETAFPGAILRTFRVSETLSPFETWNQVGISAEQMAVGGKYAEFLRNRFGPSIQDVTMTRTSAMFGEITSGGKAVGMGLRIKAGTQQGTGIADYFARITGTDMPIKGIGGGTYTASLNGSLLKAEYLAIRPPVPFGQWVEAMAPHMRTRDLIIGAAYREKVNFLGMDIMLDEKMRRHVARAETFVQLMRARAAATAGRLNILLSKPLEIPVIGSVLNKIPIVRSMAVKPGAALQMAGRYTGKALALGALWKGLEYYDYARSQGGVWSAALGTTGGAAIGAFMFKGPGRRFSPVGLAAGAAIGAYTALSPRFDSGLFHGVASIFTDANLARAQVSEKTGIAESLRRQEAITPGLISVKTALGFAGAGGLMGGIYQYGGLVRAALAKHAKEGGNFADTIEGLREVRAAEFGEKLWGSGIGKKIAKMPTGKFLSSKIKSPVALGMAAGLAAWTALSSGTSIMSGNFAAAIPGLNLLASKESPEELQQIYSGEKEVAVRKGRFWEFGRCIAARCNIFLYDHRIKTAENICIGDILIGRKNKPAKVLAVFERTHTGAIISISSGYDRDTRTTITDNHIVPILRNERICEIPARSITIHGDFVEIPYEKLVSDIDYINVQDVIRTDYVVQDKRIFASQRNWFTGKLQRSGTQSIPLSIPLNNDIGRLFGYYLAEGNLSKNNKNFTFIETVHAKDEEWIVKDIIDICERYFGTSPTVRFKTTGKKTKEGCWIVRICSSILAKLFYSLFYQEQYSSWDKDIYCRAILEGNKAFKEGLIEGYWRGDGHLDSNTKVISSARKNLLVTIQQIALSIDIPCGIGPKEENDNSGRWKLRIATNDGSKNPAVKFYKGRLFAAVRTIESEEYNGLVYDFEVDDPDHLFQAGTFLVHNSSAYEGGRIEYFRPHMLARLKQRSYQKGIYGTEEEKWQYDPALHPLKALFGSEEWKYHYEMTHQYDRPAPLTSTYGEDVPFIGPLVSATFGKLVKPRKMVRPEEWNLGNGEYAYLPDIRGETEPAYELGGLKPGAPVAPEEPTQLMNELIYRRREAVGLVGYAEGIIQKAATGREEPFKNLQTMETMGKETGGEYWLWKHLNVGGALGASEPVRRFIPHTRSYLETYNPLANTMPSWIPDDYFMDLAHGNPFSKIPEAEMRLPGPGYCLHPDTKIETRHGYVPINDISVQTSVATSSGYRPVTKTFSRDYSGELICISSYGGLNETTKLTLQHEVKAIKTRKCKYHLSADKNRRPCKKSNFCTRMSCDEYLNNKIEWTQAQDLSEGDFVLRPISTTQFVDFIIDPIKIITNNSDLDYIGHDTYQTYRYQLGEKIKNKQISLTLPESIDLWFLFGLYLAEGSLSKSRVSLTLHKDESYLVNFISNLIMIKTRDRKEENAKVVDINNKAFAILVKAMFGQSSKKTIPVGISRSQFLALLSGWIQGDGYCSKESLELSISPKYKTLLSQLTYYCNIYNINYSLSKRKTRNEYVVRILASSVDEIQLLDYKQKDKTSICSKTSSDFTIDGHRAFKIKKIWKEWYSGPVCDLEVQDAHEYCTSFIVHNSSLHPELEGVAPEDYPLAHRVKILGDVAMWSKEYENALSKAKRNLNTLSDHDKSLVLMTEAQTKAKKESRREITPYRFRPELLQEQQVTVTDILDPRRIKTKEFGDAVVELQGFGAINDMQKAMEFAKDKLKGNLTLQVSSSESRRYNIGKNFSSVKAVAMIGDTDYGQILAKENLAQAEGLRDEFEQLRFTPAERLAGRISEAVLHNVETPLEMLTPISPAAKLIRQRSAIEEYVASEAVGTGNAFWDRPVENFLRPTANMALKKIGFDQIPSEIRQRRDINEYFDMLSWTKSKQAERLADQNGDRQAAIAAKNNQQETLFGLDVFGSPVNIMKALPRRERDFYEAFSNAPTPEERAQIFSMVPENEQRVYLAAWVRQEEEAARAKKNSKIATEADEKTLIAAQMMRQTEGFGYTEDLETEWMKETGGQIPFDEWLREKKAAKYFSTHSLPGPDWLGWCVPPDQKILTSNCGFSNACDIKLDQMLTTLQGENPVEQIFERETNEKLLTIKVHHNSVHSMSATKNHIILGIETVACKYDLRSDSVCSCASNKWKCNFCTTKHYESYSARWMSIGEVTANTYLPVPLLKHTEVDPVFDISILDCFPKNTIITEDKIRPKTGIIKPMNRKVLMDEATCWLVGYYLAEGNVWAVNNRMRGIQFTAHIDEVPILELAQKIIKDKFGLDSVIRFKKTPNSNSAYLVVASGLFGWLMNAWVGRFCDRKFAPSWIEKITHKSQIALLDGLNTGDAAKDDRGRLCLANQSLCEMAKRLYEAQGIAASLHGPIKKNGKDQYIIEPLSASLAVMIGENFIAYRVESIEEINYQGVVLDFGVQGEHMYCSPIGIYHNSPSVDMEDVKLKYVEMQGLDHHDFDIWGARKRSLARKPYISEDLINQMGMQARFDEVMKTRSNAKAISKFYGGSGGSATVSYISAPMKERYNIEISDSRQGLIEDAYKHMGVR